MHTLPIFSSGFLNLLNYKKHFEAINFTPCKIKHIQQVLKMMVIRGAIKKKKKPFPPYKRAQWTGSVNRNPDPLCSWPRVWLPSACAQEINSYQQNRKNHNWEQRGSSESQKQNVKESAFLLGESQEIFLPESGGRAHPSPSVKNVGQSSLGFVLQGSEGKG